MTNLDPTLKALFDKIGINEDQLKDKDTAKFIYDFIDSQGGLDAVKREVDQAKRPLPPPPPAAPPAVQQSRGKECSKQGST